MKFPFTYSNICLHHVILTLRYSCVKVDVCIMHLVRLLYFIHLHTAHF